MIQVTVADRVYVAGQKGSYRVTSISGRQLKGQREFEGGSLGKEIAFDNLDVTRNVGQTESPDDGKVITALSYESQRFETRLLAKREREAKEFAEDQASERRREQAMDDRFNGTQD